MTGKELYERCAAVRDALPDTVSPDFDEILAELGNWERRSRGEHAHQNRRVVLRRFLADHGYGRSA